MTFPLIAQQPTLDMTIGAEEASPTLFSLSRNDDSVNLLLQGSWEAGLSAQGGLALTDLGLQAAATNNPLLFTQKADLTLSLRIKERWFIEASFLDNYDLNTYRAGYQGKEYDRLQYIGVGNTGLDFPNFPYLDMGGSSPSSFGIYGKWQFDVPKEEIPYAPPGGDRLADSPTGGEKEAAFNATQTGRLILHGLVRYDGAKWEEKHYIGSREVTTTALELSDMLRGYSFVLPDEDLDSVPVLYIEDPFGDQRDELGGRWRLAKADEYAASPRYGIVEIRSATALAVGKRLAVAYSKEGSPEPWAASLGIYGDTNTSGSGFLGAVQDAFTSSSAAKIALRDYPQPGQKDPATVKTDANVPATVHINGTKSLVIWERGTFSPFERLSRYRIQSGPSSTVQLFRTADGQESPNFAMERFSDVLVSGEAPLPDSLVTGAPSVLYELVQTNTAYNLRDPTSRWPLVQEHPELYLPASGASSMDLHITVTTYGNPGTFSIGTDVLPGSVQVFRRGLPDPLALYNPENGEVMLSSPPAEHEQIRIVYLKRSEERRFGSLSAGFGANYISGGPFTADLALGLRWNVSPDSFSEGNTTSPGTVGLSGKLSWDWGKLQIQTTGGLFYRQDDTTGLYRILGMEGSQYSEPFPNAGFYQSPVPTSLNDVITPSPSCSTENQAPLVYRSYTSTDFLGISTLHTIDWTGAQIIQDKTGPYLVHDSTLDTSVLVGEATYTDEAFWAGFQVPIDQAARILAGARHITVPFRFYDAPASLGAITLTVYLQIGALDGISSGADQSPAGVTGWENSNLVLTAPLFDSSPSPDASLPTQWQTATLTLNDADRRALAEGRSLRLVVVTSGTNYQLRTRLVLGPPVVSGTSVRPILVQGGQVLLAATENTPQVDAVETADLSLRDRFNNIIDRLHPSGSPQRVLEISFSSLSPNTGAGADTRIGLPALSNYRTLSFFVRGPVAAMLDQQTNLQNGTLTVLIARGISTVATPILRAEIPASAFTPGQWSKVDIIYNSGSPHILVDGTKISGGTLRFDPFQGDLQDTRVDDRSYLYLAVFLSPPNSGTLLPDGSVALDEILLSDPIATFQGRSGIFVQWAQQKPLISWRTVPILADLKLTSATEGLYQSPVETPYPTAFGNIQHQSSVAFTMLGILTELRGGFTKERTRIFWNAGHRLTLPLALAEIGEDFTINENSFLHQSRAVVDTSKSFKVDTKGSAAVSAQVSRNGLAMEQLWKYTLEGRHKVFFIGSSGELAYTTGTQNLFSNWSDTYFHTWLDSWNMLAPDLGEWARNRSWSVQAKTALEPQALGIIAETSLSSRSVQQLLYTEQGLNYSLSLPFSFSLIKGSLKSQRETRQNNGLYGKNLEAEIAEYGTFIITNKELILLAPGYALFTSELHNLLEQSSQAQEVGLNKLSFTESYSLSLQAPPPDGPWALLFPAQAQTKLWRTAEHNLASYTDKLSWETNLSSSALNLFGAYGQTPLFTFYKDDEFSQQFGLAFSWIDEGLAEWKTSLQQRSLFYGFSTAKLELSHTLTINQTGWSDAVEIAWTHPAQNSLVGALFRTVTSNRAMQVGVPGLIDIASQPFELFQKESLEAKLDVNKVKKIDVSLNHESILRIKNRLSLTAFGKVVYSQRLDQNSFTLIGSTGTAIRIQF